MSILTAIGLACGLASAALLLVGAAFALATRWLRAQQVQERRLTPAEKLREQAEAAIAQERLDEVAEVIERRRKRVEAANMRAAQREQREQPDQLELTSAQVATLPIPEQLAWAEKRARHRPFGGGVLQ